MRSSCGVLRSEEGTGSPAPGEENWVSYVVWPRVGQSRNNRGVTCNHETRIEGFVHASLSGSQEGASEPI